ncbi:MAG: SDR family NAD(P)-dependent oxidoreductase [Rhodobacteraceae bacterium]|nr:SDR family NAD(P)-dependent oxidoreductase [Paracoccaceae bacterium]
MTLHPAIRKDAVAVVTGGASGIGLAAARRFGSAGMTVLLADLDEARLDEAVADLGADGITATGFATDVSRRANIVALKEEADRLGPVGVLMNNAGREGGGGLLSGPEVWRDTLEVNLFGVIHGLQAFLPDILSADRPAAIVNTGSKQGITLPPGDTAYNVSKAALKALTESLAHDLLDTKGRVTAHLLIPGFTFTGFTRARGVTEKPAGAWTGDQVADFLLDGMAAGDFYILCPDNEVTRETDLKRMRWGMGDIIENRPALSRWHPDYAPAFRAYTERDG